MTNDELYQLMKDGFDQVKVNFDQVNQRLDRVDQRLDGMDARLRTVENGISGSMENRTRFQRYEIG